jgi:hypothetical protein
LAVVSFASRSTVAGGGAKPGGVVKKVGTSKAVEEQKYGGCKLRQQKSGLVIFG